MKGENVRGKNAKNMESIFSSLLKIYTSNYTYCWVYAVHDHLNKFQY